MGDLLKNFDWDMLGKWDIIFGIVGGIVSIFYGLRWIAKHARSRPFIQFISWSVTGDNDEQQLLITFKGFARLLGASLIWTIIGTAVGVVVTLASILLASLSGNPTNSASPAIAQYAGGGAFIGALFRGFIWPIGLYVRNLFRLRAEAQAARRQAFTQQKERVEKRIKRGRTE